MDDPGSRRAFWSEQVEGWRTSGRSQRAFAEASGLSYSALRRWKARLGREEASAAPLIDRPVPGAIRTAIPSAASALAADGVLAADDLDLLPPSRPPFARAEVLGGPERRRRFTREQKQRLVAEAGRDGQSVSLVARRHGIGSDLLFRWRRQFRAELGLVPPRRGEPAVPVLSPDLVPVRIAPGPPPAPATVGGPPSAPAPERRAGLIEIELAGGHRLRVDRHVDADALRVVIAALRGGEARR